MRRLITLSLATLLGGCAVPLQVGDPYGHKPAAPAAYPTPCPKDAAGNYVCPGQPSTTAVVRLDDAAPSGQGFDPTGAGTGTVLQTRTR